MSFSHFTRFFFNLTINKLIFNGENFCQYIFFLHLTEKLRREKKCK